jgi:hypothetical protein
MISVGIYWYQHYRDYGELKDIKMNNIDIFGNLISVWYHFEQIRVLIKWSLHLLFWKISIQRLRKWCFTVAIAILFHSSVILKISLRFYMFLLTHMILTIFYYIYASTFWFIVIFFTWCQKNILITPTHQLFCVKKKIIQPITRWVK